MLSRFNLFAFTLILSANLISTSATAQENRRTEIDVNAITWVFDTPPVELSESASATITIETEIPTAPANIRNEPSFSSFVYGDLISIDVTFFDAQGEPTETSTIWGETQSTTDTSNHVTAFDELYEPEETTEAEWRIADNGGTDDYYFVETTLLSNGAASLFQNFSDYPQFVADIPPETFTFFMTIFTLNDYTQDGFIGTVTDIRVSVPDADDDGITDALDQCANSATNATVLFQGFQDSTVTNSVDSDGCTIMDRYAACEAPEPIISTRRSRSFYNGPSYCEKMVAYELVAEGIISYAEARLLRDALYASYRNQPPA